LCSAKKVIERRQNAHDRVWKSVNSQGAADNFRISSELPLPQSIAEDRDLRTLPGFLLGTELSAQKDRDTQGCKESRSNVPAPHLFGFAYAFQVQERRKVSRSGHRLEQPALLAIVRKVRRRDTLA